MAKLSNVQFVGDLTRSTCSQLPISRPVQPVCVKLRMLYDELIPTNSADAEPSNGVSKMRGHLPQSTIDAMHGQPERIVFRQALNVKFTPVRPPPETRHVAIVSGDGGFHQMTHDEAEAVYWFLRAAGQRELANTLKEVAELENVW